MDFILRGTGRATPFDEEGWIPFHPADMECIDTSQMSVPFVI